MQNTRRELVQTALFWSFLTAVLHAAYLNTPFLNFEHLFKEAALYYSDPIAFPMGLYKYFRQQSNPLGYSYFLKILNIFAPLAQTQWVARLPSLMGVIILLFSLAWIVPLERTSKTLFHFLSGFCVLTPMIWTYSGRASSDILGPALFYMSLAIALHANNKLKLLVLSAFIFSCSVLVKYNMALMGLGFIFIIYWQNEKKLNGHFLKLSALYTLIPLTSLGVYLYWKYITYGFFLYLQVDKGRVGLELTSFPSIFSMYSIYLMMMLMFIPLLSLFNVKSRVENVKGFMAPMIIGLVVFAFPILIPHHEGEMNYGPLDSILTGNLELLVKLGGALLFSFFIYDAYLSYRKNTTSPYLGLIFACVIPYFLVSSFTRPAQRYLIPILPFAALVATHYLEKDLKPFLRPVVLSSLLAFSLLNIFSVTYQIKMGKSINNLIEVVEHRKIIHQTKPGAIMPHADDKFWKYLDIKKKNYLIAYTPPENSEVLHEEVLKVFGLVLRRFYLVKLPSFE